MITIFIIASLAALLAVLWLCAICAKRWAASLKRRREYMEAFFKHANGVYDEAMQPVPASITVMIDAMVDGTMDKDFANGIILALTSGPAGRSLSAEKRRELDAANKAISQEQARHLILAVLNAGLASAECSGVLGRQKAKVFIAMLQNPPRAKETAQKVIRMDWSDHDLHVDDNHAAA